MRVALVLFAVLFVGACGSSDVPPYELSLMPGLVKVTAREPVRVIGSGCATVSLKANAVCTVEARQGQLVLVVGDAVQVLDADRRWGLEFDVVVVDAGATLACYPQAAPPATRGEAPVQVSIRPWVR
jgi:hypothetical protein